MESAQKTSATEDKSKSTPHKPTRKIPPRARFVLLLIAIVAAIFLFQYFRNLPEGRPGWLRISGRIEGYEVNVGAKIAGRVEYISNREGEEVKFGQPLVKLSDEDIRAQLRGAEARYREALDQVKEAEEQLRVSREQVRQAQLNVRQAREEAAGRIEQAAANIEAQRANLSQAQANLVESEANLELACVRLRRYDELAARGAVTQDEDDQARSNYKAAAASVEASRASVRAARRLVTAGEAALVQARSAAYNPPIRQSQEAANTRTVAQSEAALNRSRQNVDDAKAAIDEIKANIVYLNITSPVHGVVTARTVEPGAVVAAGQTVISLINLDTVFLRAYVPDSQIGRVRINQRALIYYDSDPKKGVPGKVIEIDPEASFTPENIYFREERVKQAFGIKIMIFNPNHYAKPGMPADADVDITTESGARFSHHVDQKKS